MSEHFHEGKAVMVDISSKPATVREALAEAQLTLPEAARRRLAAGEVAKGDAIAVAELAGIMAAKRTAELIPLCHPLPLTSVAVAGELTEAGVRFQARCKTTAATGVEMEALTAASVAALTLYDMLKGIDKGIEIVRVRLLEKHGGKSGSWRNS